MSSIVINDLRPVGHSLFSDGESYLDELSEDELSITGGFTPATAASFISFSTAVATLATAVYFLLR